MTLDDFARLPSEERLGYFRAESETRNILPHIVEKDFWVCWLLGKFFALDEELGPFTFKGGTSLSKCYDAIARFSEDIDLGVERKTIGYPDDEYFYDATIASTERGRRVTAQAEKANTYLYDCIQPRLTELISDALGPEGWRCSGKANEPGNLYFQYPSITSPATYIAQHVLIEFGTLDAWPTEVVQILPYVANLGALHELEPVDVRVLQPRRTFWEKAAILHRFAQFSQGKAFPERKSRHYYDLVKLADTWIGEEALQSLELLPVVARYKATFYYAAAARYDLAESPHTFCLVPPSHLIPLIEQDYAAMSSMFFPSEVHQPFGDLLERITDLERRIRALGRLGASV